MSVTNGTGAPPGGAVPRPGTDAVATARNGRRAPEPVALRSPCGACSAPAPRAPPAVSAQRLPAVASVAGASEVSGAATSVAHHNGSTSRIC